jgi:hypothetical protein
MNDDLFFRMEKSFYVRSKISHYPLSKSIPPIPDGLAVVIFESQEDINEYYKLLGINDPEKFEILRVKSIYDLMREVSNIGYAGIWFFKIEPLLFGNFISEIDIDQPNFLYTFDDHFFGASGSIEKPLHFLPWRNFFKTDKMIRRFIKFKSGVPYDFSDDLYTLRYKDKGRNAFMLGGTQGTINYSLFLDASPLQGPYVSDLGAFCLFTNHEFAIRYLNNQTFKNEVIIEKVELDQFLATLDPVMPFMDIGINPGNERYLQGYFVRNKDLKLIKTVHGLFELDESNTLKKIDDIGYEASQDTIDKPNTINPDLRGFLSTIKNPLKRVLGSTQSVLNRREAHMTVERLKGDNKYIGWEKENSQFQNIVFDIREIANDSYLVYGFDKVTGDSFSNNDELVSPYVFKDIFDALLYFYYVHFDFEYDLRFNGFTHCTYSTEVSGTKDDEKENYIISENREAIADLMESILTEGYTIEHSELLMSYINRTAVSLEIEACGYLGDLAFFKETIIEDSYNQAEDSEISKKIYFAAQSYKDKLSNNIELSETYQNMIKRYLGDSYKNLSIQSECILESAIRQFENSRKIINYDYAGISMKLCKVYERELKNQVFDKWKKEASVSFDKKSVKAFLNQAEANKDRNLVNLLKFLLGNSKIELGPMKFIIDRVKKDCDHEVLENLKEYILQLNNDKYLLSEEFMEHCNKISSRYRNGGVHEKIVSYDICKEAFDNILKNEGCYLGLLLDL